MRLGQRVASQARSGTSVTWVGGLGLVLLWLWGGAVQGEAPWWATETRAIEAVPHGQVNWTEGFLVGRDHVGGPTRPGAGGATGQAAAQAARQRVRTVLQEVRLDARQRLGDYASQAGVTVQLDALAAHAEVVETRYVAGGTVDIAVQVALAGPLTALILPPGEGARAASEAPSEAVHTGIVIDARGLAIQPALLPRLVDESGQVLYAPEVVQTEAAVQQGYVAYAKAFEQGPAQRRIGERPLVLRALRVVDAVRVDLVLGQAEAARLRDYAATRRLLQQCRVLIVM